MTSNSFFCRLARTVLVGFCLLQGGLALAAEPPETHPGAVPEAMDPRARVTAYLEALGSYSARFTQSVSDAKGVISEQSAGQFWLQRPDSFRWEYQTPWPQLILTDGERIWLYDEDLEQVTVRRVDDILAQTPAGLLAGNVEMLDDYTISEVLTVETLRVTLVPRSGMAEFRYIELQFDNEELSGMRLEDRLGQITAIEFYEVEFNLTLDDELFRFNVPPGTDVVDETV